MADKLDARVLARRQKDLDGFTDRYQDILDARAAKYTKEIRPVWERTEKRLQIQIQKLFKEYSDGQGKLSEEKLRTMKYGIDRLSMLRREVAGLLAETADPLQAKLHRNLAYQYAHSYYFNAFGLEQAAQVDVRVPLLTHNYVMGVLATPWLPDGATYSDRIRANTVYLGEKMYQAVGRAMVEGWSAFETARYIKQTAQEGYYNSVRLARTELTRAASQGASHLYMQNADIMDGKTWDATLDSRTAPKDARNDGKMYPLEYDTPEMPGKPGERIPNHPNCRCRWRPLLSALGVSKRERVARGAGDSTKKFGDRIYTKARTYKQYAKERGLPDLNDRLRNDDPRRYLARGETLDDYGKIVGRYPTDPKLPKSTPPKGGDPVPVAASWADAVKARIAQGVKTEADAREVGGLIRQEIEKRTDSEIPKLEARIAELDAQEKVIKDQLDAAYDKTKKAMGDEYRIRVEEYLALQGKFGELQWGIWKERRELREKLSGIRMTAAYDTMKEIRPLGTDRPPNLSTKPRKVTKQGLIEARKYIPTAWLDVSDQVPLEFKKVQREYYSHKNNINPELCTSGNTVESVARTCLHEMGHRAEYTISGIKELEKEFYERRTAGEPLTHMGSGYGPNEVSRKDKFISAYIGKDYGGRAYEVLSMGIDATFLSMERYPIYKDPDYWDFILGVIASV